MADAETGIIFGSIDVVAALAILISTIIVIWGDFLLIMGVLLIVKALFNYHKFPTPLNPMAGLDILSAIILFLLYFGISNSLFFIIGLLQLIKGGFALTVGFVK